MFESGRPMVVAVALIFAASLAGWQHWRLLDTQRELATISSKREGTEKKLAFAELAVSRTEKDIQTLKNTPRFYFVQAAKDLESARKANEDEADRLAIAKFQTVVDRFPTDVLAKAAKRRIAELEGRISDRALETKRTQAEVWRLTQICHDAYLTVRSISTKYYHLTASGQWDLHAQEMEDREEAPYRQPGDKAQRQADKLRLTVPDPDGALAKRAENCAAWSHPEFDTSFGK